MNMCEVYAVATQKGGCSKTTSSVNLGIGLAHEGYKVLLVDADPQGDMTKSLGITDPDSIEITISTLLMNVINDEPVDLKGIIHHEEGIDFTIDGVADGGLGMKPVDVCSIFANAMDNAIEACEKLPEEKEKRIQLIMKRTERFFSIKLINSMSDDENSGAAGKLFGEGGRITTKKDKNLHGFGTQNMKAAISRYDGMLKAEAEDGIFTLSIMIPRMA